MRKVFAVALGLATLGPSTHFAFAEDKCLDEWRICFQIVTRLRPDVSKEDYKGLVAECTTNENACKARTRGAKSKSSEGGKSSGAGGSKPKQVNGQSQRTANGGIIMVTPEGKEWVWNGKYNTVATYERNGVIGEYHSVMQGDPDARWRKVNGKNMQESDPRYMAEAEAAVKKKGPVTVRDHRTPQPAPTPPVSGASTNSGTATHGASAGQAPSTANARIHGNKHRRFIRARSSYWRQWRDRSPICRRRRDQQEARQIRAVAVAHNIGSVPARILAPGSLDQSDVQKLGTLKCAKLSSPHLR